MKLAGIDLAWHEDKNPTAIAIGNLSGDVLTVSDIRPAVYGIETIQDALVGGDDLRGIAIDASLIINNKTGQRPCEKQISKVYGSRKAACHASNLTLYPNAASVQLSQRLESQGFKHLSDDKFQIECYPHPAIIEIFDLPERLKYKKGRVVEKKAGQKKLVALIRSLENSTVLQLRIPDYFYQYLDDFYINSLKGKALKSNEDTLDAVICLYIAGLYASGRDGRTFGNIKSGYVWIPSEKII